MPRKYVKKPPEEGGRRSYKNSNDMSLAFEAVKESRLGIRQAAEVYGVDYHSLLRRVNDACPITAGPGKFTLLSEQEELDLAEGIALLAEWGWGLRRENVCSMVGEYLSSKGRGNGKNPGPDWLSGFLSRHPKIVNRKSQQMPVQRMKSLTMDVGQKWYECLDQTFKKYKIEKADQVFNCDESGFATDPSAGFVLARKGSRVVTAIGGSGRGQISVLGCCSASGKIWPPFVIYKAKKINPTWTEGGHPGATYTVTESGWMETESFASWFTKAFIPKVKDIKGNKVLIFDGHNSHISIELIESAIRNHVVLLRLPSHSSHVLQPLDVAVFGPLKKTWKKVLQDWQRQNRFAKITKAQFPALLNRCWIQGFKACNAVSGFKASGIWPLSKDVLEHSEFKRSEHFSTPKNGNVSTDVPQAPDSERAGSPSVSSHEKSGASEVSCQTGPPPTRNDAEDAGPSQVPNIEAARPFNTPTQESILSDISNSPDKPVRDGSDKPLSQISGRSMENEENKPSTSSSSPLSIKDAFLSFFQTPDTKPKNKRKNCRIPLYEYGECITDSDLLERLREKEAQAKKPKKSKGINSKQGLKKSVEKCNFKQSFSKEKSNSSDQSVDEVEMSGIILCEVCVSDDDGVWVACSKCNTWFHVECAGLGPITEAQAGAVDFVCFNCS